MGQDWAVIAVTRVVVTGDLSSGDVEPNIFQGAKLGPVVYALSRESDDYRSLSRPSRCGPGVGCVPSATSGDAAAEKRHHSIPLTLHFSFSVPMAEDVHGVALEAI